MKHLLIILLTTLALHAPAQDKDSLFAAQSKIEGVKYLSILHGRYKVWTKKFGSGKIKLLLLHGGPGTSPEYFENFPERLGNDYTIYMYSQLGTYFSDEPEDISIANVTSAAEQVEEVRKGLGVDSFYLLGHSWGAFLGTVYASKYQEHLRGLIFSNSDIYATGQHQDYQASLIANIVEKIPEFAQYADSIRQGKLNNFSNPALFGQIMGRVMPLFISEHFCRLTPLPDAVERSKNHSKAGKNKFSSYLTQSINTVDYEPYLKKVSIPILFLGSAHDYLPPYDYEKMKNVAGSKYAEIYLCPNGSHFAMWDDSENYFRELDNFIKQVDTTKKG